jgi:hypothetical protein
LQYINLSIKGLVLFFYIGLIFLANKCAAQKESYNIIGMGCTLNNQPLLLPITTNALFTVDEENDVVSITVTENIAYMYLLTKAIGAENKLEYKSATFSAVDPDNNQYFINMRVYTSGEMQITIGDNEARAAMVFFIQTLGAVDGMTAAR